MRKSGTVETDSSVPLTRKEVNLIMYPLNKTNPKPYILQKFFLESPVFDQVFDIILAIFQSVFDEKVLGAVIFPRDELIAL